MQDFRAPWWLPGGHLQTIWSALFARRSLNARAAPLPWRRERWETPDGDFVDVDFSAMPVDVAAPLLVLFHGLEGSSSSHYAQAMAQVCAAKGWQLAVPHFRGCSGEPNRLLRAYHSGDTDEIGWMLQRMKQRGGPGGEVLAMGVSLGGNALARWAGLQREHAADVICAAAVVCAPLDLMAGGKRLGQGLNRLLYTRMFLRSLVPKALAKWVQSPDAFDKDALLRARDLRAFDDVFTAPVHGFKDAEDYWQRASAKPLLKEVRLPLLLLNARNDPFVPASSLPSTEDVSEYIQLWQPAQGGHVGFASGRWPSHVLAMPMAVSAWLEQRLMEKQRSKE